jgi:hypothetical protein
MRKTIFSVAMCALLAGASIGFAHAQAGGAGGAGAGAGAGTGGADVRVRPKAAVNQRGERVRSV